MRAVDLHGEKLVQLRNPWVSSRENAARLNTLAFCFVETSPFALYVIYGCTRMEPCDGTRSYLVSLFIASSVSLFFYIGDRGRTPSYSVVHLHSLTFHMSKLAVDFTLYTGVPVLKFAVGPDITSFHFRAPRPFSLFFCVGDRGRKANGGDDGRTTRGSGRDPPSSA